MKKMKNKLPLFVALGAVVFGIIALFLPFATAYTMSMSGSVGGFTVNVNGSSSPAYAYIFGAKATGMAGDQPFDVTLYRPATLALVGWILLILGVLALAGGAFLACKKNKLGKIVFFVAALLLLVAGILLLCTKADLIRAEVKDLSAVTKEDVDKTISTTNMKLGFGFIGTAVFAFLSAACSAVAGVFDKSNWVLQNPLRPALVAGPFLILQKVGLPLR